MRAPDHRRNRSFKDEINKFLKRYELTESSPGSAFFLRLRDDPDRRIDEVWKKIVDDNPSIDTASERELFLKNLMDAWDGIEIADIAAKSEVLERRIQDVTTKIKKTLARSLSETTSAKELLALLQNAGKELQLFTEMEELYDVTSKALYQNKFYQLIDIRSDHAGSRPRTVFMRLASRLMHGTTGKWHDDEVATLTDIAFPGKETSIRMVQSARQSMRRTT
jgi:hypothetical protein